MLQVRRMNRDDNDDGDVHIIGKFTHVCCRWFIQLKDYITMQKLLETGIRLERPKAKELNLKQNDR